MEPDISPNNAPDLHSKPQVERSKELAERIWKIPEVRGMILDRLERGGLFKVLCLSKVIFPEVVQRLFFRIPIDRYESDIRQNFVLPSRMKTYLDAVRVLELDTACDFMKSCRGVEAYTLFVFFPNLSKVITSSEILVFSPNQKGLCFRVKKRIIYATDLQTIFKENQSWIEWKKDDNFHSEFDIIIAVTTPVQEISLFVGSDEDPESDIVPCLKRDIQQLTILSPIDVIALLTGLKMRDSDLLPITGMKIRPLAFSAKLLNLFFDDQRFPPHSRQPNRRLESLAFDSPTHLILRLSQIWIDVKWERMKGLRSLELPIALGHSDAHRFHSHFTGSLDQHDHHHIQKPHDPTTCLHLDSFTLTFHFPVPQPLEQQIHSYILRLMPRSWEVAEFMLAVGGPLCEVFIYFELPRSIKTNHEQYFELFNQDVQRYIDHMLNKPVEKRGWWKVTSQPYGERVSEEHGSPQ